MSRFGTLVTSTVVAALMSAAPEAGAQVRSALSSRADHGVRPMAAALHGSVDGVVVDDTGAPVAGATVSALGATSALAVTDKTGRFSLYSLPPGLYIVRAHYTGYIPSKRQFVDVRAAARTTVAVSMRRADRAKLLAAGVGAGATGDDTLAADDHSEVAWRMRHAPRSVLKDRNTDCADGVVADAAASDREKNPLAKTLGTPGHLAASLFDDLPFTGQVNLLTTTSFDTVQRLFSSDTLSRSVASLSVGGPMGGWGDWAIEGFTTQGELGSWFVAGALKSHAPASHVYDVHVAYSAKRTDGGSLLGAPGVPEDNRAAGSLYAVDRWRVSPQVTLTYAARYSRYDYLGGPGFLSPRAELSLAPAPRLHIRTSVSRHLLAPGAEEFMPPIVGGLWVPTERTFDWLSRQSIRAERANNYEFQIEQDLGGGYSLTARTFYQEVQNQLAALFGATGDVFASRYSTGTLGSLDARGWGVTLANVRSRRLHGSVSYQMTTARWHDVESAGVLALLAPSLIRQSERVHDITGTVETELPGAATRVFVLYRIDSAFSRPGGNAVLPAFDGRFDVQVSQPLSMLDFTSAQWQVVFAVRNIFRETSSEASVYDELLVVRPPKRLVGGLVVRF